MASLFPIDIEVVYNILPSGLADIFADYLTEYRPVVRSLIRSLCRDVISDYPAISIFANRTLVQEAIQDTLRTNLAEKAMNLISVQIHSIQLPSAFAEAINERQTAQRRIPAAYNDREHKKTQKERELDDAVAAARDVVTSAEGQAKSLLISTNATATGMVTMMMAKAEAIGRMQTELDINGPALMRYISVELMRLHNGRKFTFNLDVE
ncbi:hypothetical protein GEMRC1_007886 [Eukaryota sp. GEM-RC1]